jgi:putative tricarboxylic transport membrane protein
MRRVPRPALAASLVLALLASAARAAGAGPECVIPAKAGGGFELTCRLVQAGLAGAGASAPLRTSYRPGGVGAVAYESAVTQRAAEADTLVAFSSGSLLNLAQGKFSRYTERDVRWVAAIAADHGVVAVRADSPYRSLRDLAGALRANPRSVTFGIGGNVGGQDWMKAALFARAAGVDPRSLRYVSFEGGGDAFVALTGGHVHVVPGDLAESAALQARGEIRVLGVLSDARVPGYAGVPTAREQGFAVSWPTLRGVYLGPKVSDRDYARWVKAFDAMLDRADFARARERLGLLPFALTGAALERHVGESVRRYADLARELGLPAR